MNFIRNIKKEDFDYGSMKHVIFFISLFSFFLFFPIINLAQMFL
jgi:hypothetical protein